MNFFKPVLVSFLLLSSVSSYAGKYVLVEENRAEVSHDGAIYLLNTYIVIFEQPYYITVERTDGHIVDINVAEKIAVEYIKPRGCTQEPERRADLDQKNEKQTKVVIGVAC